MSAFLLQLLILDKANRKRNKLSVPTRLSIQSYSLRDASLSSSSEAFRISLSSSSASSLLSWAVPFSTLSPVRVCSAGLKDLGYLGPVMSFNPFWPSVGFVYPTTDA